MQLSCKGACQALLFLDGSIKVPKPKQGLMAESKGILPDSIRSSLNLQPELQVDKLLSPDKRYWCRTLVLDHLTCLWDLF